MYTQEMLWTINNIFYSDEFKESKYQLCWVDLQKNRQKKPYLKVKIKLINRDSVLFDPNVIKYVNNRLLKNEDVYDYVKRNNDNVLKKVNKFTKDTIKKGINSFVATRTQKNNQIKSKQLYYLEILDFEQKTLNIFEEGLLYFEFFPF